MSWIQLDQQDALEFLKQVVSEDDAALFEPADCDVHQRPLSFYDGYHLTRIVNKHMIPHLLMDYLSNGEDHYYLDGSENAFHNLNARGAISLDEGNVTEYLELYIAYVYERGNSLEFVHDPLTQSEPQLMATEDGFYHINVPLLYQGTTVEGQITVEDNGAIHVKKPLKVSFLDTLKPGADITYRHPLESNIIEEATALLSETENGLRLLKLAEEQGTQVRVLSSPNYHGFITNSRICYIIMPAAEQSAKYMQALVLAGCLRDAEQIAEQYIHPTQDADPDIYETVNLGKNLDMGIEMCKIVEELENKGFPEGVVALANLGLERVYIGYKDGQDDDALMQTYVAALERYGIIT